MADHKKRKREVKNVENKWFDTVPNINPIDNEGTVFTDGSLNLIPQGSGDSERIGRRIVVNSIRWNYRVFIPEEVDQPNPSNTSSFRLILYLDKQCNGTIATRPQIIEDPIYTSFRSMPNIDRYDLLYDKTVALNRTTLTVSAAGFSSNAVLYDSFFEKAVNIRIDFSDPAGALTDITSNNLGVLAFSTSSTGVLTSRVRIRYTDY